MLLRKDFIMKLIVSNFTRIKQAEIEIDGITIIAGKNDTGKSTIGKILFSLFNSMNNLDEKIDLLRRNEIERNTFSNFRNNIFHKKSQEISQSISQIRILSKRLAEQLMNMTLNESDTLIERDNVIAIIRKFIITNNIAGDDTQLEEMIRNISDVAISRILSPNNLVICEIISRYFGKIFKEQVNCLQDQNTEASLELIIKDKKNKLIFKNNRCINYETQYSILHEAFYIDNPFIIDELSPSDYFPIDGSTIKGHIVSKISDNDGIMDGIFDAVIAREKLEEIYDILNKVIDGKIVADGGETFEMETGYYNEPIKLSNLSTGLKSFVIVKLLLEKGILKDKDILILDEPEIHLHPEWQLIYAEIIVLLQKIFDLSIIVTTHSSNFLEAIEYFSKKHSVNHKCRYYLAKSEDGLSTFENVTGNINKIYSQMIQPSVLLDELKYDMENNDYEQL